MSKRAFLIGKNTYGLKYSEKDISIMNECLREYTYEVHIPQQEKHEIMRRFDDFIDQLYELDTVILYYSGHSWFNSGKLHFVLGEDISKRSNTIEIKYFTDAIAQSRATNKLIILDCCRASEFEQEWKPSSTDAYRVLTASGKLEFAKEFEELQSGALTHFISQGLMKVDRELVNENDEVYLNKFYEWIKFETKKFNYEHNTEIPVPNLLGNQKCDFPIAIVKSKQYLYDGKNKNQLNDRKIEQDLINLPQKDYIQFIGRDSEINLLLKYLSDSHNHHVIMIGGIGGVGKTTLAIEAAWKCWSAKSNIYDSQIPVFDSIVFSSSKVTYLKAEGIYNRPIVESTLTDIIQVIAKTLDCKVISEIDEKSQIRRAYELLKKQRTLLIIDNMETLDDAQHKKIIEFVDNVPHPTKVIVTTRRLSSYTSSIKLNCLTKSESILLIKNQIHEKNQFNSSRKNKLIKISLSDYTRIYEKFQGIPIALIYAVGQLCLGFTLKKVLSLLDNKNGKISDDVTVTRFCFESSVEVIKGKSAHYILKAFALFVTSPSKEAIIEVAGLTSNPVEADEAIAILEQLSLIRFMPDNNSFDILPITKKYINSELNQCFDFEEKARRRWIGWYQKYAKKHGGLDWKDWRRHFDKIEEEWHNVCLVMDWCKTRNLNSDLVSLFLKLDTYIDLTGKWQYRLDWWNYIKEVAYRGAEFELYVTALSEIGWTCTLLGDEKKHQAIKSYIEALKYFKYANNDTKISLAKNIAVFKMTQGKLESAKRWLQCAHQENQKRSKTSKLRQTSRYSAYIKYYFAEIEYQQGNFNESLKLFKEVLGLSKEIGWQRMSNYATNYIGGILVKLNSLEEAEEYLKKGLIIALDSKEDRRIALFKYTYAFLESKKNHNDLAIQYASEALKIFNITHMQEEGSKVRELLHRISPKFDMFENL
jgi:NB-ARC domain/Caspase domain/MalT-like TPR region